MKITYDLILNYDEKSFLNSYYINNDLVEPIKYFYNFNSINIFVGANNSGKSRFLRGLINYNSFSGINRIEDFISYVDRHNELIEQMDFDLILNRNSVYRYLSSGNRQRLEELKIGNGDNLKFTKIDFNNDLESVTKIIERNIKVLPKVNFVFHIAIGNTGAMRTLLKPTGHQIEPDYLSIRSDFIAEYSLLIEKLFKDIKNIKKYNFNRIYIPTLRTAHSLFNFEEKDVSSGDSLRRVKKIRKDIFHDTIRKNYSELKDDIDVFTGLSLYNEIVNVRNSRKEKRNRFHAFEKFLKDNFFNGDDIDIIANFNIHRKDKGVDDEDLIEIFIGDNTKALHNLGDGIQALIILMYKIFLADNDTLIFIDEPEINLHPGYQRLFLEQITSNKILVKKNLTYVIVSHSNHFLDLTLEKDNVSIYSFSSFDKDKFLIRNVNSGDNQVLRDLGVNNSSVFLANSSIWVEGISDRNLVKAFLLAYCKENKEPYPREDIDFAFFEYAGSNLVHYDFKKGTHDYDEGKDLITSYALNNKILLLSDLDSGKDAKHRNILEIAGETEGFEYYTTAPYRELENLISNSIWEKVLLSFCGKNLIKGNEENVQKRISESLTVNNYKDYKKEYIGVFLNKLNITELNKVYKTNGDKTEGTFIPKAELSQIILEKVRKDEIKWSDFSDNEIIVKLTESIYDFILKSKN